MELMIHGTPEVGHVWDFPMDTAMYRNPRAVQKVRDGLAAVKIPGIVHSRYKPILVDSLEKDLEMMKTIPNIM